LLLMGFVANSICFTSLNIMVYYCRTQLGLRSSYPTVHT
jgi:hypothetical protein